jgi:Zn-dependent peptidase ImmA (M78 family)
MPRSDPSRSDIEGSARGVLWHAGTVSAPVDLHKVVLSLGARLHFQQLEAHVSGVLAIQGGDKHILINATHHPNRQRFTIAHECGHLVLHHLEGDQLFIDTRLRVYQRVGMPSSEAYASGEASTSPQQEREANQFASALLMPAPLIIERVGTAGVADEEDVSSLASAFGVSEQAMSIRLQQLGLLHVQM